MILEPVFLYCERTGPGLLAEPFNLLATLSLLVSAVLIWRMADGLAVMRWMAALVLVLFATSALFHMLPSYLSLAVVIANVLSLVLVFFFAVNRDLVGLSGPMATACTLLILPFAAASLPLIGLLPGAFGSAAYLPIVILLLSYAAVLRGDHPQVARGLLINALLFSALLGVRSADMRLCGVWPYGTHFIWILGLAVMFWHVTWVYRRHMLAGGGGGR